MLNTVLVGTDYKYSPFSLLEKLYLDDSAQKEFADQLRASRGPADALTIVSTCNRLEIYVTTTTPEAASTWLLDSLSAYHHIDIDPQNFYVKYNHDAIEHLFNVAAGIESMVFGEDEILSQLKKNYHVFQEEGYTDATLNKMFQSAIAMGKKVRSETTINQGAHSVSSVAVDLGYQLMTGWKDKKILIIGAGVMARRALAKICALTKDVHIDVCNRSEDKAMHLKELFPLNVVPYETYKEHLHEYDLLYYATGAKTWLLHDQEATLLKKEAVLVDVGLPRNVDPKIENHNNVMLITLDSISKITNASLKNRERAVPDVHALIREGLNDLTKWQLNRVASLS